MDARDKMTRLIAWLVQNVDDVESSQIKADIALLMVSGVFRPRRSKA